MDALECPSYRVHLVYSEHRVHLRIDCGYTSHRRTGLFFIAFTGSFLQLFVWVNVICCMVSRNLDGRETISLRIGYQEGERQQMKSTHLIVRMLSDGALRREGTLRIRTA